MIHSAFGLKVSTRAAVLLARRYKSVLVTGGSAGLGEAITRRCIADGYSVTIADVNVEAGQALASEVGCDFVETDVSKPDQVEAAVQAAAANNKGVLDALVNNAGVVGQQAPYAQYDIAEWQRIIDINLNGTFYGLKYGLAQMEKQETGGSIVNVSSIAGFRGMQHLGPYTASKFAVRGMTMAAAVEYGSKNIRVNAVAPTACETPMVKAFMDNSPDPEAMKGVVTAMNVLPGFPQPHDVAGVCAFLLSDDARYVTGHTLPVDSGALSRVANAPEQST